MISSTAVQTPDRPAFHSILTPEDVWLGGEHLQPRSSVVYLCENGRGEIIYVGQTADWWGRRQAHRDTSGWWPLVRRIHVLSSSSSGHRKRDETRLIGLLQPVHNKQGTARDTRRGPRKPPPQAAPSAAASLEQRLAALEREVAELKRQSRPD